MQKTTFKTRLLALLTAVFMVVMCMPFAAFADDDEIMYIKYYANDGGKLLSSGEFHKIWKKYTLLDNLQNDDIPKGQKLVGWTSTADSSKVLKGTYSWDDLSKYAQDDTLSLNAVFESEASATQDVEITYYDFKNSVSAGSKKITVAADKTALTVEEVTANLPDGYKLEDASAGFAILNGYCNVAVLPEDKPTTQNVGLVYYDFTNKVKALEKEVTVSADKTSFTAEEVKAYLPDGYKLEDATKTSFDIADGYVSIPVVKKTVPTTKTIKINYYSEVEEKQIAEVEMTVAADATYINTRALTAPEGYKLDLVGDLAINDGYVYAKVSKIGSKTVKINYYSESEEKQIAEVEMTVAPDATCVNTSKLAAPTGYELCEQGDLSIRDGYVYAAVRKVSTKEVKINFYCPEEKKQVAEPTVIVNADATCVNSSAYADLVPAGYKLAEVGDMPIRDGYVYAEVRKVATKTIKINYYSEEEEKQIDEVEMTVPADATYVNTSALTAPAGYKLVLAGDLPIRDGYVYAAVRKVPTTTIKISYVDEATDKEVGTEDLVVNQGTTVVNFNVLKSVPAGYELCEVGDFYVGNGSAKVMVRKTKSNNGSSSSSASSSSNKTTTASNEKQVVKATAAPANTTKVLPKTGASNVAPLLGGSLAVVALLMGYGVYGLVLRKKD